MNLSPSDSRHIASLMLSPVVQSLDLVRRCELADILGTAPSLNAIPGWIRAVLQSAESSNANVKADTEAAKGPKVSAEQRLRDRLEELFSKAAPEIAARIAKGEAISTDEINAALERVIRVELTSVAQDSHAENAREIGVSFDPAVANALLMDWARAYSYELVNGLDLTTKDLLRSVMETFHSRGGMTRGDIEQLLKPAFGPVRAEAIAVTEVTRAHAQGQLTYQKQLAESGINMERIWQTNNDELVCPLCGPLNGKPESEWEGTAGPPRHVRCRCFATLRRAAGQKSEMSLGRQ